MKKTITLILAFLLLCFGLSACTDLKDNNDDNDGGNENSSPTTAANILVAYFSCTGNTENIAKMCSGAREFADYPLPFGGGPSASVLRFRTYRVLSSTPAESCGMSGCIHTSVCRRFVAGKPLPPRAVRQDNGAGYRFGGGAFRSFRKISVPYRPLL